MSYSLDLRQKVVLYVNSGYSQVSAAKVFGLGESTVRRWISRNKETGDVRPLPHGGGFSSKINAADFKQYVADNPDKTLHEMGEFFGISHEGVAYNLRKHGYLF
ncbi:MAG: IS630 transposase-related protein [Rickettsiales bacterium]|nr:IS630 transposase-related protein [Pseudomonadota bacterium]MDA0966547.1 IS630 transposase-related protein [Pseudomonadota bacterium]MDG4543576.1 IS630 transposase-related protein [Rickettsiales bacterium]MDG4545723.1 IS630 transposase-related protein [Rickettsiales bacterium]MDG4547504.1 IS630 transposase-related protein [Rickettsiales bacterium]